MITICTHYGSGPKTAWDMESQPTLTLSMVPRLGIWSKWTTPMLHWGEVAYKNNGKAC